MEEANDPDTDHMARGQSRYGDRGDRRHQPAARITNAQQDGDTPSPDGRNYRSRCNRRWLHEPACAASELGSAVAVASG
jgi:hypothetical protein